MVKYRYYSYDKNSQEKSYDIENNSICKISIYHLVCWLLKTIKTT